MTRNLASMTAHVYHEGMDVVCMYDHQMHDKLNYLNRYTVQSVLELVTPHEPHLSGVCLEFTGKDGTYPVEYFVPLWYFEGKEDPMRTDEKAMADPQPVVKRDRYVPSFENREDTTVKQAQQFENVPDTFPIADTEIFGKLIATGKAPNPKAGMGDKKPSLSLCPLSAQIAQEAAHRDGMLKYGWVNWREVRIQPQTYIDAAMRHLRLYENGEEFARDTGVPNLGAVMACCAIIIDAAAHGTMDDNRKHSPQSCDMLHDAEAMVLKLKGMQEQREAKNNANTILYPRTGE